MKVSFHPSAQTLWFSPIWASAQRHETTAIFSLTSLLSQVEDRCCSRYLQAARTDSCREEGLQKLLENLTLTEFNLFPHNRNRKFFTILNTVWENQKVCALLPTGAKPPPGKVRNWENPASLTQQSSLPWKELPRQAKMIFKTECLRKKKKMQLMDQFLG